MKNNDLCAMVKVAITGGIGSGKSYVCRLLNKRGINIYDCDDAAKRLMAGSEDIRRRLINILGDDAYIGGKLNKRLLSSYILKSEDNAKKINNVVHPAVAADFLKSDMTWMECAILFSSGFDKLVDKKICVTAPLDVRVRRIMQRDSLSEEKALEWVNMQMPQSEILSKCDFEIVNDGVRDIEVQLNDILNSITR